MTTPRIASAHGFAALTALALLAIPFAASAFDVPGWYIGAHAGRTLARIDDPRISSRLLGSGFASAAITDDDRDTGYKLFAGYQMNRYFAVEGGYFDLGKFGFHANTVPAGTLDGSTTLKGVNLDLVARLPLSERWSAFGRVGATHAQARDHFSGSGAVVVTDPDPRKRATNLKFGAGLQYDFSEAFGMRAEVERMRVDDAVGNKGDVDMVSIGLVYRFDGPVGRPVPAVAMAPAPAPIPAPAVVAPPPPPPPAPPMVSKVSFSADALFDFDRATLKPDGQRALDKFAGELKGARFDQIVVTGHTDRIGSEAYNLKLSAARAEAVKRYLVAQGGVPATAIVTRGVDGAEPATRPGDCKGNKRTKALIACLAPDRRVEVEVTGTR